MKNSWRPFVKIWEAERDHISPPNRICWYSMKSSRIALDFQIPLTFRQLPTHFHFLYLFQLKIHRRRHFNYSKNSYACALSNSFNGRHNGPLFLLSRVMRSMVTARSESCSSVVVSSSVCQQIYLISFSWQF